MKVLHCITTLNDSGGAEKLMEDLLPGLRQEGCEVDCVVLNGYESGIKKVLEAQGIHVYELSHNTLYYHPMKTLKMIRYMRRYDVVHAHNTSATIHTALAGFFGKAKRVMTEHNTELRMRHVWGAKQFDRWVHNRFDYIICCSPAVQESLEMEVNLKGPKVLTVSNGVKLKKFSEAQPSEEIQQMDCKKIVMVARFREQKQHKTVMEAIKRLPEEFHVFFVGEGELMEENKAFAKEQGLENRVHFLGLRTDVPNILKAADVIVLSSHFEGLSLSSVEGMAVGKPFVASSVPGLREIVGGAGLLFEEKNAEELAEAIMKLDKDPVLYRETAERCRERAMKYDISEMIRGYKGVYERILNVDC